MFKWLTAQQSQQLSYIIMYKNRLLVEVEESPLPHIGDHIWISNTDSLFVVTKVIHSMYPYRKEINNAGKLITFHKQKGTIKVCVEFSGGKEPPLRIYDLEI